MHSILLYLVCLLFLPTLPCSADLFSPSQPVTDLSSSLDNFNWDFDVGASSTSPSQLPPLQSLTPFSSISCWRVIALRLPHFRFPKWRSNQTGGRKINSPQKREEALLASEPDSSRSQSQIYEIRQVKEHVSAPSTQQNQAALCPPHKRGSITSCPSKSVGTRFAMVTPS